MNKNETPSNAEEKSKDSKRSRSGAFEQFARKYPLKNPGAYTIFRFPEFQVEPEVLEARLAPINASPTFSPPRPFPLFNGTFAAARDLRFWRRVAAIETMLALFVSTLYGVHYFIGDAYYFPMIVDLLFVFPVFFFTAWSEWGLFFLTLLETGATGRSRVEKWSKVSWIGGGGSTMFFYVALWTVSAFILPILLKIVALALSSEREVHGDAAWVLSGVSASVFFPVFVLSTRLTRNTFKVLSKAVLRSLLKRPAVWIQLFVATGFCVYAPIVGLEFASFWFDSEVIFLLYPLILFFLFGLYALILGRMAWIIADEQRRKDEGN